MNKPDEMYGDRREALIYEIERLRYEVERLRKAHEKNIHEIEKHRKYDGRGHHCTWRSVAEALEQRSKSALGN